MKDKLSKIRKRGPSSEMDQSLETELDMEMPEEGDMVEEVEESAGGAGEVIAMLQGLDRDSLAEIRDEIDALMVEDEDMGDDMEGLEFEDLEA